MKTNYLNQMNAMLNVSKLITVGAITCSVLVFGCRKPKKVEVDVPPTQAAFNSLMDAGFKSLIQTATFDASNSNYVYTSPKGTTVTIDGTCLRDGSASVSGQVTLEFYEAFTKEDMILANKPTMGIDANTNDTAVLESGGQFYVAVKQGNKTLSTTCGAQISTPVANSGGVKPGMSGWDGSIDSDGKLTWTQATTWEVMPNQQRGTYDLNVPGFGWINCDKFYNDPRPKTCITAMVPTGYSKNYAIYLLPKNRPNSLAGISGCSWPIGLECYIIFVTEKDGKYKWVTHETTITQNHIEKVDISQAQTGSRSDYVGHVTLLR